MSLAISEETTFLLDMINFTYGPVMNVSNCENLSYTGFANGTPTGFDATSDGAATNRAGTADEITVVSGRSYYIEFDEVLNAGTAPIISLRESLAANIISDSSITAAGSNAIVLIASGTATGVLSFHNASTVTDFEITNLSVREIL